MRISGLEGEEESLTEIGLSGNRNVRASRSVFTSGGSTLVDFYWNTAKVGLSLLLSRNLYKFGASSTLRWNDVFIYRAVER